MQMRFAKKSSRRLPACRFAGADFCNILSEAVGPDEKSSSRRKISCGGNAASPTSGHLRPMERGRSWSACKEFHANPGKHAYSLGERTQVLPLGQAIGLI